MIALQYFHGDGVPRCQDEAIRWMFAAKGRGDYQAEFVLGCWYLLGFGIGRDVELGRACLERAAKSCYAPAEFLLGYAFESGIAGERNMKLGLVCFQRASDAGDLDACFALARCYATGTGVPVSHAKAFQLCSLAAQGGHLAAQLICAFCLQRGWGTARDPYAAADLLNGASAAGAKRLASFALARCYGKGEGVEADSDQAEALYRVAFEVPEASDFLARLQPEQKQATLRTLISAASDGSVPAMTIK
jgi:TPR repeat protein